MRAVLETALASEISAAEWETLPEKLRRIYDPAPTRESRAHLERSKPLAAKTSLFFERFERFTADSPGQTRPAAAHEIVASQAPTGSSSHDQQIVSGANEFLKKAVFRFWEGTPLTWNFAKTNPVRRIAQKPGASWLISRRTRQALTGDTAVEKDDLLTAVREWTEMAEDLIVLQLLRHLSQFVAQLRVMVSFIVLGSFTLLLAINSYPFPMQNRAEFLLTILIAVAAATILRLIIGINRDETISRVARHRVRPEARPQPLHRTDRLHLALGGHPGSRVI